MQILFFQIASKTFRMRGWFFWACAKSCSLHRTRTSMNVKWRCIQCLFFAISEAIALYPIWNWQCLSVMMIIHTLDHVFTFVKFLRVHKLSAYRTAWEKDTCLSMGWFYFFSDDRFIHETLPLISDRAFFEENKFPIVCIISAIFTKTSLKQEVIWGFEADKMKRWDTRVNINISEWINLVTGQIHSR